MPLELLESISGVTSFTAPNEESPELIKSISNGSANFDMEYSYA